MGGVAPQDVPEVLPSATLANEVEVHRKPTRVAVS